VPKLAGLFGGPELMFEIDPVIGNKAWNADFVHYAQYVSAPATVQRNVLGGTTEGANRDSDFARMAAYAGLIEHDPALGARAWAQFLHAGGNDVVAARDPFKPRLVNDASVLKPITEIPNISTNTTAQWCLNAIELLQLAGAEIPAGDPTFSGAATPRTLDGRP